MRTEYFSEISLSSFFPLTDISVAVTTHTDGSFTITEGDKSKTVTGSVQHDQDTNRQTCILNYDQRTVKCDSVVLADSVYLFTEVCGRSNMIHIACIVVAPPQRAM